ncbi:hypothetical protein KO495_06570 [Colwellia sp. D2M02]|uniref:Lipoprotein n=1 Tax=Colwellia asteriadis TaxID=517723 RepID=A0ABN1L9J9_9GAMM|nr:hypothetical protein [Colwellia sp. D2M02]MBU2892987.1 hypothetical protein [Colwellia sp. D2M02]
MKTLMLLPLVLMIGCSSKSTAPISTEENPKPEPKKTEIKNNKQATAPTTVKTQHTIVTVPKTYAPHLWSGHKALPESVELCAQKSQSILNSLGFKSVVQNGNYTYGNFNDNRAALKCFTQSEQTIVYYAVAGPQVTLVEKLRNEIAWKF